MGDQLTILDTMFLELEQVDPTAHMHIGAALIFGPLPGGGAPEVGELRELIGARMGLLPRFAQRLSAPEAGPLTWLTWEPAADFDIRTHLRHATLPAPGGEQELRDWLGDFWSHRLDRHLPLWEIVLLDGLADGRWAMATKTHHCLVDGVGSLDIGDLLLDTDPDAPPPPEAPLRSAGASEGGGRFALTPGLLTRGAKAGLSAARHPRRTVGQMVAAADLIVRDEILAAPQTSLNQPLSGTRHYRWLSLAIDDIDEIRARLGGTLNDAVLAVCTGGLRRLLLARGDDVPDTLRAQIPVNVRTEGARDLGNELTSLFVELPVGEADPLARHARLLADVEARKHGSQRPGGSAIVRVADLAPPIAGELLARSMFGSTRMFNLTITNVPGPKERRYALGAQLQDVLPLVPLFSGHDVGIAVVSYAGRLMVGINADRVAAPDVDVLAEGLAEAFDELRAVPATP